MAHLLEDKLYDDCEFSESPQYGRIKWRIQAGGWTERQVVACGVTYRECCELVVVGCLCELCMARLMRDEALHVADYWNEILDKHARLKRQREVAEWRQREQQRDQLEEAEERQRDAAAGIVRRTRKSWEIQPGNDD